MEKTFTVAGTSNLDGVVKFRFANDLAARVKVLTRNGHTDINLIELPEAMTKDAAIAFLETADITAPADADTAEDVAAEIADATDDEFAAAMDGAAVSVAAEITEAAIQDMMATLPQRTARGHFVKKDLLREQAIAALTA